MIIAVNALTPRFTVNLEPSASSGKCPATGAKKKSGSRGQRQKGAPIKKKPEETGPSISVENIQYGTVIVTILASFNNSFISSAINVALPAIGWEFRMDPIMLGWVSTAFLLTIAPLLIPFGKAGDIYGCKKIFVAGQWFFLAATLAIAMSPSGNMIIAFRTLQGFAAAMMFSTSVPIVVAAVPLRDRGHILGVVTAAIYFGYSTGPFLGGIITHHLGWRFIFWFSGLLCLPILLIAHFVFKGRWEQTTEDKFDFAGAIFFVCGLLATIYGFSTLPAPGAALVTAAGLSCLAYFVYFENKRTFPLVDIGFFRHNSVFAFSILATLISYTTTFAVGFLLSLYLQKVKAMTSQDAGLILVAQPIVLVLFSSLTGRLSDRMEPNLLASWGTACTLIGMIMLIFLRADSDLSYVLLCLVVQGIGFALFSSPNTNAVISSVDGNIHGIASATLVTMRHVGMTLSMAVVMIIMSLILGKADITPTNTAPFLASMHTSFLVFGLMCIGGIFASLAAREEARDRRLKKPDQL